MIIGAKRLERKATTTTKKNKQEASVCERHRRNSLMIIFERKENELFPLP